MKKLFSLLTLLPLLTACLFTEGDEAFPSGPGVGGGAVVENLEWHVPSQIPLGEAIGHALIAHFTDGHSSNVTDLSNFETDSPEIVAIDNKQIVGLAIGEATLSAQYRGRTERVRIEIGASEILAIEFSGIEPSQPAGTQQNWTLTANWSDGETTDITASAEWSSAQSDSVHFSAPGEFRAMVPGEVEIQARFGQLSVSETVEVTAPEAIEVVLTQAPYGQLEMLLGDRLEIAFSARLTDDTLVPLDTPYGFRVDGNSADTSGLDFVSHNEPTLRALRPGELSLRLDPQERPDGVSRYVYVDLTIQDNPAEYRWVRHDFEPEADNLTWTRRAYAVDDGKVVMLFEVKDGNSADGIYLVTADQQGYSEPKQILKGQFMDTLTHTRWAQNGQLVFVSKMANGQENMFWYDRNTATLTPMSAPAETQGTFSYQNNWPLMTSAGTAFMYLSPTDRDHPHRDEMMLMRYDRTQQQWQLDQVLPISASQQRGSNLKFPDNIADTLIYQGTDSGYWPSFTVINTLTGDVEVLVPERPSQTADRLYRFDFTGSDPLQAVAISYDREYFLYWSELDLVPEAHALLLGESIETISNTPLHSADMEMGDRFLFWPRVQTADGSDNVTFRTLQNGSWHVTHLPSPQESYTLELYRAQTRETQSSDKATIRHPQLDNEQIMLSSQGMWVSHHGQWSQDTELWRFNISSSSSYAQQVVHLGDSLGLIYRDGSLSRQHLWMLQLRQPD
ncbi:hypothetical protein [Ferrimonas pelagia]|uniref:Uncharacterized protein n=1 Tax=Ferrimonas pelagia TaxID=1177826 RepID=A0ABP9EH26_9GAMM